MGTWDSYQYERGLAEGKHLVEILSAEPGETKEKHDPKITLIVRPNNRQMRIFETIVKNEKFNWRMSLVFDCFNIERGNFDFASWVGAIGLVDLKQDGDFMRIGRYYKYDPEEVAKWEGPKPELQTITKVPGAGSYHPDDDRSQAAADDDDELPF